MCGRYVIFTFDEVLEVIREIEVGAPFNFEPDWPARRVQAYPNSAAPLIVPRFDTAIGMVELQSGSLCAREMGWGFEEPWRPGVIFNTRIESAMRPTWRDSMEHRRCVIPVASFYETHRSETHASPKTGKPVKRQYEFRVPGKDVVLIGCTWKGDRFSMVTTEANADMAPVHHRMPLVVRQEELPLWFGPDYRRLADRSSIRLEAEPA
ncbi:SOS response-associated peptidase family protein [Adlercreutzia sp. ZJ473]|uniref:SOS response-associated peptidase family protein n=1 Tax=Adlercreutzia sp. ZJ473 TaxID=2722822 RepID=UPI0015559EFF|nr:SOS response-associated peptidase family protein [Adlercreutzia sp. ZJ473]